ncbi:hypothetical protein [Nitrincola sp. MINF-07-Sa-05]|uniref:hypothetical protein n=1 Tax=Nitrincola salilacus TaxID=3400273 RepID=UPI003918436B
MYSRAISSKQPFHSALLAAGAVLFLIAFSILNICTTANAQAATSSMEHQWSAVEQPHNEQQCHHENTSREVIAQSRPAKPDLKPDFFLLQLSGLSGLANYQTTSIQTATYHLSPSAPIFLLTQRLRL